MAIHNVKGNDGIVPNAGPASAKETGKSEKSAKAANAASAYAKTGATPPSIKDAANVQISPEAKAKAQAMALANKVVRETPDVDEEKITQMKDRIAKGQYKPDANKIAEGIAREAFRDALADAG